MGGCLALTKHSINLGASHLLQYILGAIILNIQKFQALYLKKALVTVPWNTVKKLLAVQSWGGYGIMECQDIRLCRLLSPALPSLSHRHRAQEKKQHAYAPPTSQQMASDPGSHFWLHPGFTAKQCFVPPRFCWLGSWGECAWEGL